MSKKKFKVLEICAGAGGQALGLEKAGFDMAAAAEIDKHACKTLSINRPSWEILEIDIKKLNGKDYKGVDILAGGVPCPPFSFAGKQLGADDDRDLFPEALRLASEIQPSAIMLENVRGFASDKFIGYRTKLFQQLAKLGYRITWRVLNSADYGVPQLRPRFILVALRPQFADFFQWPEPILQRGTVAEAIGDLMLERGWTGGKTWLKKATSVAPTLVGGSKKHGGADLGPTRAKRQWAELGVDGKGIVDDPPGKDFPSDIMPRLTLRMAARIQGFPDSWIFSGGKTASYRQIGNAFPPPIAEAVGKSILAALLKRKPKNISKGQKNIFGDFEILS